jgi:hypothetical protein
MIEAILFVLELAAMLLVLVAVVREGRPGNTSRLGFFDYLEEAAAEPARQKGRPGA